MAEPSIVAFGVNDEALWQVVHVAVSSRDGTPIDTEELLQFCKQNMPNYMVPTQIHSSGRRDAA